MNAGRGGATLLELLVVIAVVGVLLALLLPAVQYCREVARQSSCRNKLRQIALAIHAHEGVHGHLPTGGWGWRWHGEPDRGFDKSQPGGWIYNVLPFIEKRDLRDVGLDASHPQRAQLLSSSAAIPLANFLCPTRRGATAFPYVHPVNYVNMVRPAVVARSDYAACAGDAAPDVTAGRGRGPTSLEEGDSPNHVWVETDRTGLVFRRSTVRMAEVNDGLSNTYLVGEKYVASHEYLTGTAQNDDQHLLVGYDSDTLRVTDPFYPPFCDANRFTSDHSFGSAHAAAFNMAMADASVTAVAYNIDLDIHRWRGNRHDGQAISTGN
jgi:hypothetical protein